MKHTIFKSPAGEDLVIMSLADFETLQDAADAARHDEAMAAIARGEVETLTAAEAEAALAAPTPLAFWRARRGMSQTTLAEASGLSQSYLSGLEKGDRQGKPEQFLRLAKALRVRMEDLVEG